MKYAATRRRWILLRYVDINEVIMVVVFSIFVAPLSLSLSCRSIAYSSSRSFVSLSIDFFI